MRSIYEKTRSKKSRASVPLSEHYAILSPAWRRHTCTSPVLIVKYVIFLVLKINHISCSSDSAFILALGVDVIISNERVMVSH
jgi:hypothetical protein